ncbi:MAG: hypothetical protein IJY61_01075 [Candidatus Gastranaerophilales bacterium]|nr:hypothetical protein [Candidatus Gastranaerophilales bacterium]
MLNMQNKKDNTFSLRKIPISKKDTHNLDISVEDFDKVKILELSNLIDKWEEELLFSKDGFYSIKGKNIEDKMKEFIKELDSFILKQISLMKFQNEESKKIALEIKRNKVLAIKNEMQKYEQEQLKEWQLNVFEDSLSSAISRAVLYKSNEQIILSSFKNAHDVIRLISQKEKWDNKTYKAKMEEFNSRFYYYLISEFIQDKDSKAVSYFDKFKDFLLKDEKENLEKNLKEFKVNVIGFNFAKELFSYKLSDVEQEKELRAIKDEEIKNAVKKFLSEFISSDKKQKIEDEKKKNLENWQEIIDIVEQDIDKAYLYIDYSLSNASINAKKHYISSMKKYKCIVTDKKKFIDLITELFEDFIAFKQKDISDFQASFSKEDYNLLLNFQNLSIQEFEKINIDYKYLFSQTKDINFKKQDDKYDFIKLIFSSFSEYKKNNKKEADLKARNEIIDLILNRFKENKK